MISREFIYEFLNFDDISARENDKKSHAEAFSVNFEGVWYNFGDVLHIFGVVCCGVVGLCRPVGALLWCICQQGFRSQAHFTPCL